VNAKAIISDERSELLERSRELATLRESLAAVAGSSQGRLVLIAGEAGAGKTSLLRRLAEEQHDSRFLWGSCAALFTPGLARGSRGLRRRAHGGGYPDRFIVTSAYSAVAARLHASRIGSR
jgi:transcriptional regulator with AAA-type ATPase domain